MYVQLFTSLLFAAVFSIEGSITRFFKLLIDGAIPKKQYVLIHNVMWPDETLKSILGTTCMHHNDTYIIFVA